MKKWIKNLLIAAAILAALGVILTGVGLIMGGVSGLQQVSIHYSSEDLLPQPAVDDRYAIDPAGIRELEINWVSGEVTVQYWEGEELILQESAADDLTARTRLAYAVEEDCLKVEFLQGWKWLNHLEGKNLVVLVPRSMEDSLSELKVETVSADVNFTGMKAGKLEAETVSGEIRGRDLEAREADMETVSGSLELSFTACPLETELESVSGEILLTLPKDSSFTLKTETVSGTFSSAIPAQTQAECRVDLSTVSGDLEIRSQEPDAAATASPDVGTGATVD